MLTRDLDQPLLDWSVDAAMSTFRGYPIPETEDDRAEFDALLVPETREELEEVISLAITAYIQNQARPIRLAPEAIAPELFDDFDELENQLIALDAIPENAEVVVANGAVNVRVESLSGSATSFTVPITVTLSDFLLSLVSALDSFDVVEQFNLAWPNASTVFDYRPQRTWNAIYEDSLFFKREAARIKSLMYDPSNTKFAREFYEPLYMLLDDPEVTLEVVEGEAVEEVEDEPVEAEELSFCDHRTVSAITHYDGPDLMVCDDCGDAWEDPGLES